MTGKYLLLALLATAAFAQDPVSITPYQLIDARAGNAIACSNCSIYTYAAGTNTPLATYTSSTLATPNTNPVLTNSAGYAVNGATVTGIWVGSSCYKFVAKDSSAVTLFTQDNICDRGAVLKALLAGSTGAAQIGFQTTGGTVPTTVAAAMNSTFLYDIGFATAALACASTKTVAVTSNALWSALSTMTCGANLWFPSGTGFTGITPASGQIFTQNGSITAALSQRVFSVASGGFIVAGLTPAIQNPISVAWWTTIDGTTDNTTGFQAAFHYLRADGTGASTAKTGRVMALGPIVISATINWNNFGGVLDCEGAGAQGSTPKGSAILWATGASAGIPMFKFDNSRGFRVQGCKTLGNTANAPSAHWNCSAGAFGGGAANQNGTWENIWIEDATSSLDSAVDGFLTDGLNANCDSMVVINANVTHLSGYGFHISRTQNVAWQAINVNCTFNKGGCAGVAGQLTMVGGSTAANGNQSTGAGGDWVFVPDPAATSNPKITLIGSVSDGATRMAVSTVSGGFSTVPTFQSYGGSFNVNDANFAPNDGACGGSTAFPAGSFVVGGSYTIVTVGTTDFTLIGAASNTIGVSFVASGAGAGTGTATRFYPSCTYFVDLQLSAGFIVDINGTLIGDTGLTPKAMFNFAGSVSSQQRSVKISGLANSCPSWDETNFLLMTSISATPTQSYQFDTSCTGAWRVTNGPLGIGANATIQPTPNWWMNTTDNYLNTTSCAGTCTLDLSKGLTQTFQVTGNVTAWVFPYVLQNAGELNITICSSGGGYTVASPTYFGGQVFGGWGFSSAITINTCAQQSFRMTGTTIRTSSINSTSAYQTGITP